MRILLAVIIFSAVILFHELGHFLLARWNKIVVTEFSLGFGPRLLSWGKGETRYSIKAIPFGGSCAMLGEDTGDDSAGTFLSAPVLGRIAVVAAGPVFNFILAFLLCLFLVGVTGYDPAQVTAVAEDSTVSEAGLLEGDVITRINGYKVDLSRDLTIYLYLNELQEGVPIELEVEREDGKHTISYLPPVSSRYLLGFNRSGVESMTVESIIPGYPLEAAGLQAGDTIIKVNGIEMADGNAYAEYLLDHPLDGSPVDLTYVRDGQEYECTITPMESRSVSGGFNYGVGYVKVSPLGVLKYAALEVKYMIRSTILSLRQLVTGHLGMENLSGPVGVVDAIGETYEVSKSEGALVVILNLISMMVLLSANLGVMNLLPLPALDGGRLIFLIWEAITRKPVNPDVEGSIHFAGMVLLLGLMVFVMYHDIVRLF